MSKRILQAIEYPTDSLTRYTRVRIKVVEKETSPRRLALPKATEHRVESDQITPNLIRSKNCGLLDGGPGITNVVFDAAVASLPSLAMREVLEQLAISG